MHPARPRNASETASILQSLSKFVCSECEIKDSCEVKPFLEEGQYPPKKLPKSVLLRKCGRALCGYLCPFAADKAYKRDFDVPDSVCEPTGNSLIGVLVYKPLPEGEILPNDLRNFSRPNYCRLKSE